MTKKRMNIFDKVIPPKKKRPIRETKIVYEEIDINKVIETATLKIYENDKLHGYEYFIDPIKKKIVFKLYIVEQ
jgi:hypothetical protein